MHKTHLGLPAERAQGGAGTREEPRNGYLEGPFAPVTQEVTAHDLQVTGKIPQELNGRFLRVGGNPNPVDPEDPRTYNWFIGSGMVFGVRLRDGKAEWYRNRFVRDDRISATLRLPRVPGPDQLSRREPYREKKGPRYVEANVTNTHVFAVNGRTYAFAEAGVLPMELSYELETVARSDFGGTLNGAWTGHPHRDPVTGELHGIAYFWQWDHASYQVLGTDGTITKRIDVPLTGPSTIHDMAFTEKHAVFLDGPVIFNEAAHAAGYGTARRIMLSRARERALVLTWSSTRRACGRDDGGVTRARPEDRAVRATPERPVPESVRGKAGPARTHGSHTRGGRPGSPHGPSRRTR
jgi:carotenoid cleavage dioxygenase